MNFRSRLLMILMCSGLALLLFYLAFAGHSAQAQTDRKRSEPAVGQTNLESAPEAIESLRGGWTEFVPFQSSVKGRIDGPQGLDVDLLAEILGVAHMEAHLSKKTWSNQLQDLLEGRSDIALGAFMPADGDDRCHYSRPYRWARVSLFVRTTDENRYSGSDVAKLISEDPRFRLGVIKGRLFQNSELNRAINRATQTGRIVYAESDEESLQSLLSGHIDGFVGDRLGVAAVALDAGLKFRSVELPVPETASVHFLLSKKTVSIETLDRINAAITTLDKGGELIKLSHNRIFSIVMSYALDSTLFFVLGTVGTVAFAISGVIIAYRESFSLFGALVLSALPAVGGGALRDLLFNRHPIGVMQSPLDLCLVGATVLIGFGTFFAVNRFGLSGSPEPRSGKGSRFFKMAVAQEVCDAAGIAAFTASGLAVAISVAADPLWQWGPISAMLSAAGGGILRDIVRQSGKVSTLKDNFYAEVPLIWGFAFSVFLLTRPNQLVLEELSAGIVVTVVGAFLTRLLVVFFGVRAIPFRLPAK